MHINIIQDATDDHCFGCSEASAIQIVTPVGYVSMRWWTQMFSKLTAQKGSPSKGSTKLTTRLLPDTVAPSMFRLALPCQLCSFGQLSNLVPSKWQ